MGYPSFNTGDVLAAADMNAVGLWRISSGITATNGTVSDGVVTINNTVSSVTVSNVFSANYDCYRIIVKGGSASTATQLRLTIGSANSGYYQGGYGSTYAGATNVADVNNGSFFAVGNGTSSTLFSSFDLFDPFAANETTISGFAMSAQTAGSMFSFAGYLNNTTSYTAFTLTASTGTLSGGTIRIYGYRN